MKVSLTSFLYPVIFANATYRCPLRAGGSLVRILVNGFIAYVLFIEVLSYENPPHLAFGGCALSHISLRCRSAFSTSKAVGVGDEARTRNSQNGNLELYH